MEQFGQRLRAKARELGLSDAEVARRSGLSEGRYGNYVVGKRQPDFLTLLRIADVLGSCPNELLGFSPLTEITEERDKHVKRLQSAAKRLSDDDLQIVVAEAEAILALRERR